MDKRIYYIKYTLYSIYNLFLSPQEPYTIKASSEKPEEYSTVSPLAAMAISSLLGRLTVLFHTSEENLPKLPDRTDTAELKVRLVSGRGLWSSCNIWGISTLFYFVLIYMFLLDWFNQIFSVFLFELKTKLRFIASKYTSICYPEQPNDSYILHC